MSKPPTQETEKMKWLKDCAFSGQAGAVFRGMATLAAGNVAARVIGIAAIPVLTRLYSPEDFGALAVFTSLISVLAPIITLRYVLAVPLPRRDGMAINLLALSSGLMLLMVLIVGLGLCAFGPHLLGLFSMEVLAPYWWLIILGLIGGSGYEMLSLWATRRRAYKSIAQTTAVQSLLGNLTKLGFGFLAIKPLGLLIGHVVSSGGGITSLWLRFRADFATNRRFISISRIKLLAGRYRHFPMYRLPSQSLLALSMHAPLLLTAVIYDAQTTGQLGLAFMAMAIPMNLIGHSMSGAYYAEASKIGKRHPRKLRAITKSVIKSLFFASIFPAMLLFLIGEWMFIFLFGADWSQAGAFASILSLYLMTQFMSAPIVRIFSVLDKEKMFLFINLQRAILIGIAFIPSAIYGSSIALSLTVYSFLLSLHRALVILYVLSFLRKQELNLLSD
jgi:O-antigen/teichoic acid export membrane protein